MEVFVETGRAPYPTEVPVKMREIAEDHTSDWLCFNSGYKVIYIKNIIPKFIS